MYLTEVTVLLNNFILLILIPWLSGQVIILIKTNITFMLPRNRKINADWIQHILFNTFIIKLMFTSLLSCRNIFSSKYGSHQCDMQAIFSTIPGIQIYLSLDDISAAVDLSRGQFALWWWSLIHYSIYRITLENCHFSKNGTVIRPATLRWSVGIKTPWRICTTGLWVPNNSYCLIKIKAYCQNWGDYFVFFYELVSSEKSRQQASKQSKEYVW